MDALIKNAFVLGAGLGTRLGRLTAGRPKPLIPVCNKPLITFAFDHLIAAGITKFVVNTHHCHEAYDRVFPDKNYRGLPVSFRHEEILLETAGGVKNVEDLLQDEPFIVYNGDVLSDLPVEKAMKHHLDAGNEVTLVLRSSGGPPAISFDEKSGRITDVRQQLRPDIPGKFLFTGIYIVNPEFFPRIPAGEVISVRPIFCEMIRRGEKLGGIVLDEGQWWDLGTREQYLAVHRHFKKTPPAAFSLPEWIAPDVRIGSGSRLSGATAAGAGTAIGDGVQIEDCVLWENVEVVAGASLRNCIVTSGRRIGGAHTDADF